MGLSALWWSTPTPAQLACVPTTPGIESMTLEEIQIQNNKGEILNLEVLLADDLTERAAGFQYVCPGVIQSNTPHLVY